MITQPPSPAIRPYVQAERGALGNHGVWHGSLGFPLMKLDYALWSWLESILDIPLPSQKGLLWAQMWEIVE